MARDLKPSEQFVTRLFGFIVIAALFGSGSIFAFYRFTLESTAADQKFITGIGAQISAFGILIYIACIAFIVHPLVAFARQVENGEKFDDAEIMRMQESALRLGPRMCALAAGFYLIITPINLSFGIRGLGWPISSLVYGVLAGGIAALILIPLALNLALWAVRPVLDLTFRLSEGISPARRTGLKISVRWKFVSTFLPMLLAALLFSSMIGYSQTKSIYNNLAKMENRFVKTPEQRTLLVDKVEHKTDPQIRSAEFYRNRVENLGLFYIALSLTALGIAAFLAFLAASEITRPIKLLVETAEKIGQGEFKEKIRLVTNDELSDLAASINSMTETITGQVVAMRSAVDEIRNGIAELEGTVTTVLTVAADQSTGATQQASAISEAGSISEQMLASSRQIAQRAENMDKIAASTLNACRDGEGRLSTAGHIFGDIVKQTDLTVDAMSGLVDSFNKSFKIVELIEEIASQTELLALNAELEAAGAGEFGRRFGVVAEANHGLAVRAGKSVENIRALLRAVQNSTEETIEIAIAGKQKVALGERAITEVFAALKKISSHSASTSHVVREITLSTEHQSTASEELTASMGEVKEIAKIVETGALKIQQAISDLRELARALLLNVENRLKSE